jgi:hypothetical protein
MVNINRRRVDGMPLKPSSSYAYGYVTNFKLMHYQGTNSGDDQRI